MKKEDILSEIRRTAKDNNDVPLGNIRLEKETGIKKSDWYGIYWAKRSDADKEAGYEPNKFSQEAYDKEWLIEQLIDFIKEKGKYPTIPEFKLKKRSNKDFPSITTFYNLGKQHEVARKVIEYCKKNNVFPDVIEICKPICKSDETNNAIEQNDNADENDYGFVYLIKHDKDYKIGKAKHAGKRNYDLGLILPRDIEKIHVIRTDDPAGIEKYWHDRFKDKRGKGEWFNLTSQDVKTFKRRKFM